MLKMFIQTYYFACAKQFMAINVLMILFVCAMGYVLFEPQMQVYQNKQTSLEVLRKDLLQKERQLAVVEVGDIDRPVVMNLSGREYVFAKHAEMLAMLDSLKSFTISKNKKGWWVRVS